MMLGLGICSPKNNNNNNNNMGGRSSSSSSSSSSSELLRGRWMVQLSLMMMSLLLLMTTTPNNASNNNNNNNNVFVSAAKDNNAEDENWKPVNNAMTKSSSSLFSIAKEIQVNAPSKFPKPTYPFNDPKVEVIVTPEIGKHRPNSDVVMAYAEGYGLAYYMCFIETLRSTGYDGDIVLATSEYDLLAPNVLDYLKQQDNLIVYIHQLDCYGKDQITPSNRIMKGGSMDIFQMCKLNNVYGYKDPITNEIISSLNDPRIGRVVATLRYEWYWIWSQHYNKESWIMLIDARDSFFQSNPFANVPRNQNGLLYFFGENTDVTRIGKSTKNRNWILRSYGSEVLNAMSDKPTICSGSTMGEQIAIETYLRALINEWDETDIKMTGADQGFHNYLYYSGKLQNSDTIKKLVVWEQGKGIINNLGALRTKTFSEWGFYNNVTHEVYNWDGTLSPVAHQWDRDKNLHSYYQRHLFKNWEKDFITKQKLQKENNNENNNLRGGGGDE